MKKLLTLLSASGVATLIAAPPKHLDVAQDLMTRVAHVFPFCAYFFILCMIKYLAPTNKIFKN